MKLNKWVLLCTTILAGCTSTLEVFSDKDTTATGTGTVPALSTYLPDSGVPVKLIFIHGVADHCPGYALSSFGWMSEGADKAMGLTPVNPKEVDLFGMQKIYSGVFMGTVSEERSYVAIVPKTYTYQPESKSPTRVDAFEITWSPMTQWMKSVQLGFDTTKPWATDTEPGDQCFDVPVKGDNPQLPSRLILNRYGKEQLLDRTLVDTIMYVGTYGAALQMGVADAICRSVRDAPVPVDKPCVWPGPNDVPKAKYIFVTHSLGGRLLYDTLLGLLGTNRNAGPSAFSDKYRDQAKPFVKTMMRNMPVVYMMANQLALLGLANADPHALPSRGAIPYKATITAKVSAGIFTGQALELDNSSDIDADTAKQIKIQSADLLNCNTLCALAGERALMKAETPGEPVPRLDIVAFSDTNDLLSWSIPSEYSRQIPFNDGNANIRIVNVYVKNATHWFGLLEWPPTAHGGYFKNETVPKVIRCGAQGELISPCARN